MCKSSDNLLSVLTAFNSTQHTVTVIVRFIYLTCEVLDKGMTFDPLFWFLDTVTKRLFLEFDS